MTTYIKFIRPYFFILSILFLTAYTTSHFEDGFTLFNILSGIILGSVLGAGLLSLEYLFNRTPLRVFNIAIIGLFFGYLMGEAIWLILNSIIATSPVTIAPIAFNLLKTLIFLSTTYLSTILTARSADEFYLSIPFIQFKQSNEKKKEILLDTSVLLDPRLIDLAASGLIDKHLVIPLFIVDELNQNLELEDETIKIKARIGLEVLKKLDSLPSLDLRYLDKDFSDIKDEAIKLVRIARMNDMNILTADMSQIQQSAPASIKIINIHSISNALKPITQSGEHLSVKIQCYGKKPRQGVGYLEDGTMVVVNGGAEFLGETTKVQVLSVKHNPSGRIIFCNAASSAHLSEQEIEQTMREMEGSHSSFFVN